MELFQALWLGLVQGLTEFLPVSSSGHLVLMQKIFGIGHEVPMLFDVLLHMGTLVAVFCVYWRRILDMFLHPNFKEPLKWDLVLLVIATIPAVIAALLFGDFFEGSFEGEYLGYAFLMTTLILWLADLVSGVAFETKEVKWYNAVVMGLMQAVAIVPGLSRSGSTISGGIATGLSRKRAADFAFLMSIPAILGSMVLELVKMLKGESAMNSMELMPIIVGVLAATISGFLAIKFMLKIVRRVRLPWFGLYTGLLGIAVLLDQYFFHYFF